MSYDISLVDPVTKETLHTKAKHDMRGGLYAVGGTTELWLNITWNYAHYYYEATDGDNRFAHKRITGYTNGVPDGVETEYGIRGIYGKTGGESIPMLKDMIARIEKKYPDLETSDKYWDDLPGNAVKPLYQLLAFAQMRPDGVWDGD